MLLLLLLGCTVTIEFPGNVVDEDVRECPALPALDSDPGVWIESRIATPYPICLKARL